MEILKKILWKILGRKEAFFCKCIKICQIYIPRVCNKKHFWEEEFKIQICHWGHLKSKRMGIFG